MTRLMTLAVLSLLLAACATATRYQPLGYGGGYSDVRFDANTYKVSFRGNGLTSRDRVETFLMYRLAELTSETGHDYFIIVGSSTDRRQTAVSTPSTFTATTTSVRRRNDDRHADRRRHHRLHQAPGDGGHQGVQGPEAGRQPQCVRRR
jgi:hypothetical protein